MDRIVIFTQTTDWMASTLLRATLEYLSSQQKMKLAAVCLPRLPDNRRLGYRYFLASVSRQVKMMSRPRSAIGPSYPLPVRIDRWAKKLGFQIIVPPDNNINHADFLYRLRDDLRATVAISYLCLQRFSPQLLSVFDYSVNYHNGLLPDYKGIRATAWSVYRGEKQTGFTFHLMNRELDEGAILRQGAIPVAPNFSTAELDLLKARKAAADIPQIMNMVLKRCPGRPQQGRGRYFSRQDAATIQSIADVSTIHSEELAKRLRAFGSLRIRAAGQWYLVTKIRRLPQSPPAPRGLYFRTSDGARFAPVRINYLPASLYRLRESLNRKRPL